jgi:hypothetical protein
MCDFAKTSSPDPVIGSMVSGPSDISGINAIVSGDTHTKYSLIHDRKHSVRKIGRRKAQFL